MATTSSNGNTLNGVSRDLLTFVARGVTRTPRGLRWVYGYFFLLRGLPFIIREGGGETSSVAVKAESLGISTGMIFDGRYIYTGDRFHLRDGRTYTAGYDPTSARFVVTNDATGWTNDLCEFTSRQRDAITNHIRLDKDEDITRV